MSAVAAAGLEADGSRWKVDFVTGDQRTFGFDAVVIANSGHCAPAQVHETDGPEQVDFPPVDANLAHFAVKLLPEAQLATVIRA